MSVQNFCVRFVVAAGLLLVALVLGTTSEAVAQSCSETGYTYNASCSGSGNAAGTTVSAAQTAIAAAAATQGLIANRISSFRAAGGAPGARASNGQSKQIFSFGTSGADVAAAAPESKSQIERKRALQEANSRYDETPSDDKGGFIGEALVLKDSETTSNRLGVSAGENPDNRFGLWANGAYFRLDGSKANANIESDILTSMVGLDYRVGPRLLVGISAGYETTDTDTKFNRGTVESDGFVVAPYMSIGLTDRVSIDAVVGYASLDYDLTRRDPLSNALITGSTEADRMFGSVDLVAGERLGNWLLEGRIGASHLHEEQDGFRESNGNAVRGNDITVNSANLGARVGYSFQIVEPYIAGLYSYDFNQAEGVYDDRNTFGGALGMNFWLTPRFTVNIEGKASHKEDLDIYGGSATVRLAF
jgi:outer membrane autotransporter protein